MITVKAYSDGNTVIEVSDNGHGMDADETAKITEPFYRVDKSRSRSFGGAGLGLSICKLIADLHGATLDVVSMPNVGTTVKFTVN
jgi:signal transduction histidine kinase